MSNEIDGSERKIESLTDFTDKELVDSLIVEYADFVRLATYESENYIDLYEELMKRLKRTETEEATESSFRVNALVRCTLYRVYSTYHESSESGTNEHGYFTERSVVFTEPWK